MLEQGIAYPGKPGRFALGDKSKGGVKLMALEYEVRSEFQSLSFSQLLDASVMCFQGVGDTQNELLTKYFGIKTVRQLANLPFFIWALGIQEMALRGGEARSLSVEDLSKSQDLKFSIRSDARGKTSRDLLDAPVNVLDGLTPAQNLALYDAFRITNVIQLAHNRIMLEARVIEYLEKHPEEAGGSGATKDEIASILGTDTAILTAEEAQQALSGGPAVDEGLSRMAGELSQHVQSRIDAMKERAAARVQGIGENRETESSEEIQERAARVRQGTGGAQGRIDALREVRQRTETTRIQSIAARAAERPAAGAGAGAGASEAAGGPPSATVQPPAAEEAQEVPPGAEETVEVPPAAEPPAGLEDAIGEEAILEAEEARPLRSKPWIWAAAAAILVVIVGLAIWLTLPGEEPVPPVALQPEPEATSAEPAPAPQAAIVQPPPPPPGPAIRTIHTVRSGQSLWRISRRHYRRGVLWPEIFKVNQDQIDDPDLIFPKQQFRIPEVE